MSAPGFAQGLSQISPTQRSEPATQVLASGEAGGFPQRLSLAQGLQGGPGCCMSYRWRPSCLLCLRLQSHRGVFPSPTPEGQGGQGLVALTQLLTHKGQPARGHLCRQEKASLFPSPGRMRTGCARGRNKCSVNPSLGSPDPKGQRACVESPCTRAQGQHLGQGRWRVGEGCLPPGGLLPQVRHAGEEGCRVCMPPACRRVWVGLCVWVHMCERACVMPVFTPSEHPLQCALSLPPSPHNPSWCFWSPGPDDSPSGRQTLSAWS